MQNISLRQILREGKCVWLECGGVIISGILRGEIVAAAQIILCLVLGKKEEENETLG